MQWAIRSRESNRSSVRLPTGSSLVFIDPMALRRSAVPSSATVATASQEPHTMATTASSLARAFGIVIRQISELMSGLSEVLLQPSSQQLRVTYEEAVELQVMNEVILNSNRNVLLLIFFLKFNSEIFGIEIKTNLGLDADYNGCYRSST